MTVALVSFDIHFQFSNVYILLNESNNQFQNFVHIFLFNQIIFEEINKEPHF